MASQLRPTKTAVGDCRRPTKSGAAFFCVLSTLAGSEWIKNARRKAAPSQPYLTETRRLPPTARGPSLQSYRLWQPCWSEPALETQVWVSTTAVRAPWT